MIRGFTGGIWREVNAPRYGRQDQGVSPGGAQDRFSWSCARWMLGDGEAVRTWELILPPVLEATAHCVGVLTGGDFEQVRVGGRPVYSGTVFELRSGETLTFGMRRMGFRTYLGLSPATSETLSRVGLERGPLPLSELRPKGGALRVLPGPEATVLPHWSELVSSRWSTGLSSSDEGVPLVGVSMGRRGDVELGQMTSGPVVDGTLQCTPQGLILLLRGRPTVGGYPRIGVVVDSDVDLAAQIPPRRRIRFRPIDASEAQEVMRLQRNILHDQYRKWVGTTSVVPL